LVWVLLLLLMLMLAKEVCHRLQVLVAELVV
jgi:hypothetical protein